MAIDYDSMLRTAIKFSDLAYARHRDADPDNYNKSIKTLTKDLILQFPLLISEQLKYETAKLLAEGFERENTLLVKLLLQNDLGSLTDFGRNTKADVTNMLKKIHTNIDSEPLNEAKAFHEECLKQLVPIEDKFNKYSLNEGTLPRYLLEDESNDTISVSRNGKEYYIRKDLITGLDKEEHRDYEEKEELRREKKINFVDKSHSAYNPDLFEKINKIAPTMVEMNIHMKQDYTQSGLAGTHTNSSVKDVTISFGVKCVVHQLKSEDIIANIKSSTTNTTLFKFIKWTTGEYSFAKGIGELLFDYDRMKTLGIQASKTSNYWWFKLRKLKNNSNSRRALGGGKNIPTKTATLVLSKEEIDFIATNFKVDLKQAKTAYNLMNDLFLLNFVYVDETTELVHMFDEVSKAYIVKDLKDFENKDKHKKLDIDDIKSLFGR